MPRAACGCRPPAPECADPATGGREPPDTPPPPRPAQHLEAQHHGGGEPARIPAPFYGGEAQHHILELRLRRNKLAAHRGSFGAVKLLPDPAEQIGFHLPQHPHRFRAPVQIDQEHRYVALR